MKQNFEKEMKEIKKRIFFKKDKEEKTNHARSKKEKFLKTVNDKAVNKAALSDDKLINSLSKKELKRINITDLKEILSTRSLSKQGTKEKLVDRIFCSKKPKRALTAYFQYIKARRESLKNEMPQLKSTQLVSRMAEEWNEMNDAARLPYAKLAEWDKHRYDTEKKKYEDIIQRKSFLSVKRSNSESVDDSEED